MSKRKNKRKNTGTSIKQIRASQRNEKKRKMLEFVKAARLEEAYALIPKEEIDMLLTIGFRPINVLPVEGEKIPNRYLMTVKKIVHDCARKVQMEVAEGSMVSLYDYYLAGEMLTYRIRSKGYSFKNKDKVLSAAKPYLERVKNGLTPNESMHMLARHITESISSPDFGYIILHFDTYKTKGRFGFLYDCFYLSIVDRQKLKVTINNKRRTVYRLGMPGLENEMIWMKILPEKLGVDCGIANLQVDVYIQNHAIMRLKERLSGMQDRMMKAILYNSVHEFKTSKNSHGQTLLQFNLKDKKLGYFVYRYVDGIVVITTFLLITNNGTPEGEKLHDLLGVKKEDKQYLGIDIIKTFINSDLKNDKRAIDIFRQAGCGDLFELPSEIFSNDTNKDQVAELFIKYLELENENDAELVGEPSDSCRI